MQEAYGGITFRPFSRELPKVVEEAVPRIVDDDDDGEEKNLFPFSKEHALLIKREHIGRCELINVPRTAPVHLQKGTWATFVLMGNTPYILTADLTLLNAVYKKNFQTKLGSWANYLQTLADEPKINTQTGEKDVPFVVDPALIPRKKTSQKKPVVVDTTLAHLSLAKELVPTFEELHEFAESPERLERLRRAPWVDSLHNFPTATGLFEKRIDRDVILLAHAFDVVGSIPEKAEEFARSFVEQQRPERPRDAVFQLRLMASTQQVGMLSTAYQNRLTVCLYIVEKMQGTRAIPCIRRLHVQEICERRSENLQRLINAYYSLSVEERRKEAAGNAARVWALTDTAVLTEVARKHTPRLGAYAKTPTVEASDEDEGNGEVDITGDATWFLLLAQVTKLSDDDDDVQVFQRRLQDVLECMDDFVQGRRQLHDVPLSPLDMNMVRCVNAIVAADQKAVVLARIHPDKAHRQAVMERFTSPNTMEDWKSARYSVGGMTGRCVLLDGSADDWNESAAVCVAAHVLDALRVQGI